MAKRSETIPDQCFECESHQNNGPKPCTCAKNGKEVCRHDPKNKGGMVLIEGPIPSWCPGFVRGEGWK